MMSVPEIHQQLLELAKGNQEYAKFNKRIVNTKKQVLGVRVPNLRKLAKTLTKSVNYERLEKLFSQMDFDVYEHSFLLGLMINYARLSDAETINLTKIYLKSVDSWAEVDIFAEKRRKFDQELWFNFVNQCLKSSQEFVVRFSVVWLMGNALDQKNLSETFAKICKIKHDGYYVKMGLAWLYVTAAVEHYRATLDELQNPQIDNWVKNKAYQKMRESFRLNADQKAEIKELRQSLK